MSNDIHVRDSSICKGHVESLFLGERGKPSANGNNGQQAFRNDYKKAAFAHPYVSQTDLVYHTNAMSGTKPTKNEEAGEAPPTQSNTKQDSEQGNFEIIDAHDADEKFEITPDAKDLPENQDLDAVGKPFAGARAAEDAAEKKGGAQSQAGQKKEKGAYWSKEGDRSASGAKK